MMRIVNYAVLCGVIFISVVFFRQVQHDRLLQFLVGVLLSLLYVIWGIIYHSLEGDLHMKVVIEYLLVGLIAVTLIATVVWA